MYVLIENFNGGLDTRRLPLAAKAGSLQVCNNAHITRGGEIEKRFAFAPYATIPAGTFGLQAAKGSLYVFGSVVTPGGFPANLTYQRLQSPSGAAMTRLVHSDVFNGKIYAVAEYADGGVYHFYDGTRVTSWDAIATSVGSLSGIADRFAALIDADPVFVATSSGSVLTVSLGTAALLYYFSVSTSTTNGGGVNDQAISVSTTAGSAATPSTASFTVTSVSGQSYGTISLKGVDIFTDQLMSLVGETTNQAATRIANLINAAGSPISASVVGSTVTLTSLTFGTALNGFSLAVSSSFLTIAGLTAFSGGTNVISQVSQFTFSGTFEVGDTFSITLVADSAAESPYLRTWKVLSQASAMGRVVRTFNSKMYAADRSFLYFSEINAPITWNTGVNGAGTINLANQDSGFETLTGLGLYQGKLAAMSRRSVQIWTVDPDPTKYVLSQTLRNIGVLAPRSVVNFGDLDVFFLSDTGVRSLRARDASNAATVSDVGTNVDELIQTVLASNLEATTQAATGILEPVSGRYWLAIGSTIYVYSYYPTPGISAWSTYTPGFSVSDLVAANGRVYARGGNSVYLYGGRSGVEMDYSQVDILLPYIDAGKPAHTKGLRGFDLTSTGVWDVYLGCDTSNPDAKDFIGTISASTFDKGRIHVMGVGSHVGVRIKSNPYDNSPAKIGNLAVHFEIGNSST